jgi:hypothetical protein
MPAGASRSMLQGGDQDRTSAGGRSGRRRAMRGRRRALVWTLIVVASLIGLGSILTTWVHRQMLDNQSWKDASAQLIENPEVQNALSVFLVNELYDNVDVASGLEQSCPPTSSRWRRPVAAALRQPATRRGQAPARGAARTAALDSMPTRRPTEARQRARGQDRPRDLDRQRGRHARSRRAGDQIGTELGVPASALAKIPPDTGG